MWKQVLDFDLHANHKSSFTKEIVAGKTYRHPMGGFVGVANVGMEPNWLGHPLAVANLYGFARLAWNPDLGVRRIVEEWTRLTFGSDPLVVNTIVNMQLASWNVYESYTGPLGIGTLTNIVGTHYGPGVESSERNGWGQWHRADHDGVGMDRTVATGTGYTAQYSPEVGKIYESLKSTPDEAARMSCCCSFITWPTRIDCPLARRSSSTSTTLITTGQSGRISSCATGSGSRGGLTANATRLFWIALNTKAGMPLFGEMRLRIGSCASQAFPMSPEESGTIASVSKPKRCN